MDSESLNLINGTLDTHYIECTSMWVGMLNNNFAYHIYIKRLLNSVNNLVWKENAIKITTLLIYESNIVFVGDSLT